MIGSRYTYVIIVMYDIDPISYYKEKMGRMVLYYEGYDILYDVPRKLTLAVRCLFVGIFYFKRESTDSKFWC